MKLFLFSRDKLADSCDFGGGLDPEVYQGVGEFRHDFGQFPGVAFRKVVLSFVRKFVAGISAGVADFFNVASDASFLSEKLNLFPKHGLRFVIRNPAGLCNVVSQLLQADPKQYTCAPRRKGNDTLRFAEFFQSFFRHVLRGFYASRNRVLDLVIVPENKAAARLATGDLCLGRVKNFCHVFYIKGVVLARQGETLKGVPVGNRRFKPGNNRQCNCRCERPAVRAFIGV